MTIVKEQMTIDLPGIEEGSELLTIDENIKSKRYTAARIEEDQKKVETILYLLGLGIGIRKIAQSMHVSNRIVMVLRDRYQEKVATVKKGLARKFGMFAELGLDRMIDKVDSIPLDKLPIAVGIATEKMQLLDGEATMITGNASDSLSHEQLGKKLDDLLHKAIPVQAVEMGCDGGAEKQKGERLELAPDPGVIDNESTANDS